MSPNEFRRRAGVLALACLAQLALATGAAAQALPPEHYTLDPRGVDLVTGRFYASATEVVIGQPGAGGMAYGRTFIDGQWFTNQLGTINTVGGLYVVSIGAISESFTLSGSNFISTSGNGSTLTKSGSTYAFTSSEGATAWFTTNFQTAGSPANVALITTYQAPNGERVTYAWNAASLCMRDFDGNCMTYINVLRLQGVFNNLGYLIKYEYAYNGEDLEWGWNELVRVTGVNQAVEYCNPSAAVCTLTQPWPEVTYRQEYVSGAMETVVEDVLGNETRYRHGGSPSQITAIRWPGSTSDNVAVAYDGQGRAVAVADASGTWTYNYADVSGVRTTTATGPQSQQWVVLSDLGLGRATSVSDGLGRTTEYTYDGFGRLTTIIQPEDNEVRYTFDTRGNVTEIRAVAKPGSGLADIVTTVTYPPTCANALTCNQPSAVTDPRGGVTDYTYDAAHGGVLTVTEPAPSTGATRPQTRLTYGSRYAWYRTSPTGSPVQAPTPVVLPIEMSACVTGASCAGTAAEIRTTVTYGTSGVANNLLPTQISTGSGDGTLTATQTLSYSAAGDLASVDGPLAGAADTTAYRYDAARRLVGVIGPDPDATGPLPHRATRLTYDSMGQPILIERGTVTGYTDPNWAAFVSLQQVTAAYDAQGRLIRQGATAGGVTYSVSQFSYDASGRLDCSATRMNPSSFGALPSSACTLATTGSFGPDRITRATYDAASQLISVTSAYGLPEARTESATYTANGSPETFADGEGNLTTMVYDGFGRVSRARFPLASNGSVSSTTDYVEYSYDAASNVTSERLRDGQSFSLTYDALNRPTALSAPVGTPSVAWTYDNLGRMLTATDSASRALSFAYDALGRQTTETSALGTFASQFDLAGRRTRLTWPDAFYVAYDYDLTGAMTAVRENGATSGVGVLATYAYDSLGRRSSMARGNGVSTSYGYDAVSRLNSLAHDFSGSSWDQTYTFTHNPAGQIAVRTASNDTYAWGGHYNVDRAYTLNGLNQVTTAGGVSLTYDQRGNLTNDGTRSWGYDALNRVTTFSGFDPRLEYDPAGRLVEGYEGAAWPTTRFAYDGLQLAAEYNHLGQMDFRYVPGPGLDEVVTAYTGSGTTTRNWLISDRLGSVVALANGSGAASQINRYDEYGVPAITNQGRFGFTGQMWLPQIGAYHYRARAYPAGLGRFLQTDPTGYADGMNWYAYVSNDPQNLTDPLGLQELPGATCGRPGLPNCEVTGVVVSCPRNWVCIARRGVNPSWRDDFGDDHRPIGGGGGDPRMCELARHGLDRTRGALPRSLREGPGWNDPERLTYELGRAEAGVVTSPAAMNALALMAGAGAGPWVARLAFARTAVGALVQRAQSWFRANPEAANIAGAVGAFAGSQAIDRENYANRAQALTWRLVELANGC